MSNNETNDEFMVYGRAGNRRVDLEAKLRDAMSGAAPTPDWFSYDESSDTLTIHGIKYAGELMRDFGRHMPQGQLFELVARQADGALCVKRIEPATASGDELPSIEVTEAMIDAYLAFTKGTTYLSHPEVPYHGTDKGDSKELWTRRLAAAAIRTAVSAATKPTADLSKLTVYEFSAFEDGKRQQYLLRWDVQSLLATKPAAPAAPGGWVIEHMPAGLIVGRENSVGCYPRKEGGTFAERILYELAIDLLAAAEATPMASADAVIEAREQARNEALEEAAEALDAMNDSSGDAAAYDGREQNIYELEREHAIAACAAQVRSLKAATHTTEGGSK